MDIFIKNSSFMGIEGNHTAPNILMGIPLDVTTSHKPGARWAPLWIRVASQGLEEYSPRLHRDLRDVPLRDVGDLALVPGRIEVNLEKIEAAAEMFLREGKFVVSLGGEHLITYPLVRTARKCHPDLAVVQMDAHADLRKEYEGEKFSHATVMNLIGEEIGFENLYQVGIRSLAREELDLAQKTNLFLGPLLPGLEKCLERLKGRPLYLTLDIDVVDPAFAPGTGAPEPGGATSQEILEALYLLKDFPVVALDLVEVSPPSDRGDITSLLAAKILREALLLWGKN